MNTELEIKLISESERKALSADYELDKIIFDLDSKINMLSSQADTWDYLVSAASGLLCGMLDILWVGEFSLERGRGIADEKLNGFVQKTAKLLGCKKDDVKDCVKFLEDKFPIPADGNTPDFGGGLQHHLRDFAHHPTIVGLMFSLLTQFTEKSYGTDKTGRFIIVPVPEKSRIFIGKTVPEKIIKGTVVWFFHLVSDIAGSSSTAGRSGGTGLPGPLLSIAKELSALPIFQNLKVGDNLLSVFLSKLFNGTLFAKHDANGKIIKGTEIPFDLRGEIGAGIELSRQAIPVIANDCIVRCFYFIRRFAVELKKENISTIADIPQLDWNKIKPWDNPTITRMLTVATGVFTAVDVTEAALSEKLFLSVNYVGIGRFVIALGGETKYFLKRRDVATIKKMYEDIRRNTFTQTDNNIYKRMENTVDIDKFGLTAEQTEILYNLEMYKTINDMNTSSKKKDLKIEWLDEWKKYMESGFAGFVGDETAVLHWYTVKELHKKVEKNAPENTWFRLMLLEAMLFEPYYPLSLEKDKKGNDVPSEKYSDLKYDKDTGDEFLESFFTENFYQKDYIKRLRKCYGKVTWELNEVLKSIIKTISITSVITLVAVFTAGTFAPAIAVALVGSNFAGLSGAALTSACLAYLGGGAVAAGGLGMAGGTAAIVGGGAILGLGVGSGVSGVIGISGIKSKEDTILQSAKLMVAVREIFLNDEHDIEYSDTVYEQYVESIKSIEHHLIEMKYRLDEPQGEEKKKLDEQIKNAEESVKAMQTAMKSMRKFNSSFAEGISTEN